MGISQCEARTSGRGAPVSAACGTRRLERGDAQPHLSSRHRIPDFTLHRPATLADVLELLDRHGERATLMAGGVDVMNRLKAGVTTEHLVWLPAVVGLDGIEDEGGAARRQRSRDGHVHGHVYLRCVGHGGRTCR